MVSMKYVSNGKILRLYLLTLFRMAKTSGRSGMMHKNSFFLLVDVMALEKK